MCGACFCSYGLLYCDMPGCIGCAGDSECLCIGHEVCCKPEAKCLGCEKKEGHMCDLGCGCCSYYLKSPTVLCKEERQVIFSFLLAIG